MPRQRRPHYYRCDEHKAILDSCKHPWRRIDANVTTSGEDRRPGRSEPAQDSITDKTVLVSIMAANNEIGVLQPMKKSRALPRAWRLFHSDAVQALGKLRWS